MDLKSFLPFAGRTIDKAWKPLQKAAYGAGSAIAEDFPLLQTYARSRGQGISFSAAADQMRTAGRQAANPVAIDRRTELLKQGVAPQQARQQAFFENDRFAQSVNVGALESGTVRALNPVIGAVDNLASKSQGGVRQLGGMRVFRGGEKFDPSRIKASGKGVGAYFTTDESFAKGFADELLEGKYGKKTDVGVDSFFVSNDAKILKRQEFPKRFLWDYEGGTLQFEDLKKLGGPHGLQDKVAAWAKRNGYDVVDYAGNSGKNLIVLDPRVLKVEPERLNAAMLNSNQAPDALVARSRALLGL